MLCSEAEALVVIAMSPGAGRVRRQGGGLPLPVTFLPLTPLAPRHLPGSPAGGRSSPPPRPRAAGLPVAGRGLVRVEGTRVVLRPQLCPPYPRGTGDIPCLRQNPLLSVRSARLNCDIKSALMNYSEGFGVKLVLEKYMFQIS